MIERSTEMEKLNQMYQSGDNQLVIMYGRKNVGKTTLLNQFQEGKKAIHYTSVECSDSEQFDIFKQNMMRQFDHEAMNEKATYGEVFRGIDQFMEQKALVIIDEFHHGIKSDERLIDVICQMIDGRIFSKPCLVVLCSSSISWVENDMLQKIGPIAFKITSIMKVQEIGFVDVVEILTEYSAEDCIIAYSVLGGMPYYLAQFSLQNSIEENIKKFILHKDALLYREAENILKRDLREVSIYNTILYVIAQGNNKLNDIHNRTGYSRAKISVYMKNLSQIDLIEKISSVDTDGKENTKKGIYRIKDNYIHFYYRFVFPNISMLEQGLVDEVYDEKIAPYFSEFIQVYFVKVCREYLSLLNEMNQLPIQYDEIGEWHGKEDTIDIIAQNSKGGSIVGKCSWNPEPMTADMYEGLLKQMEMAKISASYIYLFSKSGFAKTLIEGAKRHDWLKLVDIKEF